MISLKNVRLRRGADTLLEHIDWTIHSNQRIAVIGANGTGKSSLFGLLLGELETDSGELYIPKHLRIAHVAQETPALSMSALDFTLEGDAHLREIERKIALAEQHNDGEGIAKWYGEYGHIDGYTARSRAATLLAGLGFSTLEQEKPVSAFSGGWRMRLNLSQALIAPSDLLLLDEPTNHLDLDAILWLEQWLKYYSGTLLLISHDQEFLDKLATHVVHLENKKLNLYTGNYSDFERIRAEKLSLQQAMHEKQVRQREHMQKYVDRFRYQASKARQAQSRLKAIEKMEVIAAAQVDTPFTFGFREATKFPNPLIYLRDADIGHGNTVILKNINLTLSPNMRLGLLGPNGAGKSTLIKCIAGELKAMQGERHPSDDLTIGYFAQHQVDHLRSDRSPMQHMKDIDSKTSEQDFRNFLGSFNFRGTVAFDPIQHFSGGEKARLALAIIIWQKPNLLLLDEPTNHLDIDMRQALCLALQQFEGGLLIVSHDRHLIRTTCDQLCIVYGGKVEPFEGDLEDYQKWLFLQEKEAQANTQAPPTVAKHLQGSPNPQAIKKLEARLKQLHDEKTANEKALSEPNIYESNQKSQLAKCQEKQIDLQNEIDACEERWLSYQSQLDDHQP